MKHFHFASLAALLYLFAFTSAKTPVYQTYQYNYENVLGTSFELKVNAPSENIADTAEQLALDEIDRLNHILSTYSSNSEISQWLKTYRTAEKISPELFEVFTLFDLWKNKTSGALSASAAIASNLWITAVKEKQIPAREKISRAREEMRQPQWILDSEKQTATHLSHQPLSLNSFVKCYIIQKVANKVMSLPNVKGAVINIGGDMVVVGEPKETIRITNPLADAENDKPIATLRLQNKAIATSGNYRRGFQIGSQWFSHILDVRTAMPVSEIISATVIAKDATDAGALATAFNILSPEESAILAKSIAGVDYQIITKTGEEIVSDGWNEIRSELADGKNYRKNLTSDEQYEVSIDLELAQFQGRFRRPFVAVWVENKKKESVRTLAIWFNKPRWLPDLKKWFGKNQSIAQDRNTLGSISSATRSAGKYTLIWDGLDDAGQPAPSGKYTVYIEAAREHGTYQLLKQDIDWKAKSKHFDLQGGVEITSASIDLHPKRAN